MSGPEGSSTTDIMSCVYLYLYMNDLDYMKLAYHQAQLAYKRYEVPIGCVIVRDGEVIAKAYNLKRKENCAIYHAEVCAIKRACKKLNTWILDDCTLYVTLEPCMMCMGAIIQSRVGKVVYACSDPKGGCAQTLLDIEQFKGINHYPEIVANVYHDECSQLLKQFFAQLRRDKNGLSSSISNV